MVSLMVMVSCDEHEPIDLDIHPGYILCSDGRIVSPSVYDKEKHTPVAVVFAERTEQHGVLAVLLDELLPVAFADTLSFDQQTSSSETDYDGYINTVALQTTLLERDSLVVKDNRADPRNYYGSPLGNLAFRHHWFLQSDYVPSVAELGLLYSSLSIVNPVIEQCSGTPISCASDYLQSSGKDADCWYWSSTEVSLNKKNQAWLFSMADGSRHKAPKTNCYHARLIVEYHPLND